jgi:hypothetical protein
MTFRPVPAFVAAALAALALAPSAVAGPAQETDGECADPPQLGQRGASQGKGEKRGHVKRQEQALRCLARAGQGTTRADFNGDGIGDLVVGVPEEDLSTGADAGAVNVIYGSANGLTDAGNQLLTQIFTRAGGNPPSPGTASARRSPAGTSMATAGPTSRSESRARISAPRPTPAW